MARIMNCAALRAVARLALQSTFRYPENEAQMVKNVAKSSGLPPNWP
jgi:hypothetical protein